MTHWTLGIIGGSGLYAIDGLEGRREETVDTVWGAPSDTLVRGRIGKVELVFLPRHGKGHRLTPTEVPYRANIAALKAAGCTDVAPSAAPARNGSTTAAATLVVVTSAAPLICVAFVAVPSMSIRNVPTASCNTACLTPNLNSCITRMIGTS
jgi:hypothetical protein